MTLVDIGNSTYHIMQDDINFKISINNELPQLKYESIYYLSVNDIACKKLLHSYPNAINIKNYFTFNTKNSSSIGLDRVAVCSYINHGIIVDCGSAITVDIMKNSEHLGGFIMPGIEKLKFIYPSISSKLKFDFEYNINLDKIPLNTNDAINYAIIKMIILPIKDIAKKYDLKITFTGEHSKLIIKHFTNSVFEKNLVFDSMKSAIKGYK